jgi:hypothetical protein
MFRKCAALVLLAIAITGCREDTPGTTAAVPTVKSVRVSPKNVVLGQNQGIDIQVVLSGFAAGVSHQCRLEPETIGTVAAVGGTCRITTGGTVFPGRLIAQAESVADTVSIVIFATR